MNDMLVKSILEIAFSFCAVQALYVGLVIAEQQFRRTIEVAVISAQFWVLQNDGILFRDCHLWLLGLSIPYPFVPEP